MCTLVSKDGLALATHGLAFLTSTHPLGPVLVLWLHSRTCSHRLTHSPRDPIPSLSLAPNWKRRANNVLWVCLNTSVLLDFIPNQQVVNGLKVSIMAGTMGRKRSITVCPPPHFVELLINVVLPHHWLTMQARVVTEIPHVFLSLALKGDYQ